ncbi:MAG: hypothetical protein R2695_11835 [Acidimicrobiales bacterium]
MAGLASLGSRAGYLGKVRADQLGEVFIHDLARRRVRRPGEGPPHGPLPDPGDP